MTPRTAETVSDLDLKDALKESAAMNEEISKIDQEMEKQRQILEDAEVEMEKQRQILEDAEVAFHFT